MEPEQNTQAHCSKGLWEIEFSGLHTSYPFLSYLILSVNNIILHNRATPG